MQNGVMYSRLLHKPFTQQQSFFLFGPRGTGKTSWIKHLLPKAIYFDLLNSKLYSSLLADPNRLESYIPPKHSGWIVIDEVQKVPTLLNEVHRLIELKKYRFVLTGSCARSLRRKGVNLLAGRALTYTMHPLTAIEMGKDFSLTRALSFGCLPAIWDGAPEEKYLSSYVKTYLREEVLQEGLTRNLGQFSRFLECASFSQGCLLNMNEVAREANLHSKLVSAYFDILEDLLIAVRIPVFTKRAKRQIVSHPKFYFFDAGVFRSIRPKGILDSTVEIDGSALETLLLQELRAINDAFELGYQISYWRTRTGLEVDFVLYGPNGFIVIEVKRSDSIRPADKKGLEAFLSDYPMAKGYLFYLGKHHEYHDKIHVIPFEEGILTLRELISSTQTRKTRK